MPDFHPTGRSRRVELFVCSGCEMCDPAAVFLRGWANGRPNVALEIIPVLRRPEQVVRLGISHPPALVVDGELLAQSFSVDTLADLLRTRLDEPKADSE